MKKLFVIFLIILLTNCGEPLKRGTVVEKCYEPERTYFIYLPMTMISGKTSYIFLMPMIMHDSEDYVITIEGRNANNETQTETYYVTKEQYECISTGDTFVAGEDCSTADNNNSKRKATQEEVDKYGTGKGN